MEAYIDPFGCMYLKLERVSRSCPARYMHW
jgi:hypothetical protein